MRVRVRVRVRARVRVRVRVSITCGRFCILRTRVPKSQPVSTASGEPSQPTTRPGSPTCPMIR